MPASRPSAAILQDRDDLVFKALSSAPRREIIRMLSAESGALENEVKTCCGAAEVCACRFAERLGLSAATISHHMTILREAGLVAARKEGTWVYYRLDADALATVLGRLTRRTAATGAAGLCD